MTLGDAQNFRTVVFDCDGVLLNSNSIKTSAFHVVASQFGAGPAEEMVRYHVENGGISRQEKFKYLLSVILGVESSVDVVSRLCDQYSQEVRAGLMTCAVAEGLEEARARFGWQRWMVVSGGAQNELRDVFAARDMEDVFDGGIFGNPDDKVTIFRREVANGALKLPAVYLGDSRYDHVAATAVGLDFRFISRWTEFSEYKSYCRQSGIQVLDCVADFFAG